MMRLLRSLPILAVLVQPALAETPAAPVAPPAPAISQPPTLQLSAGFTGDPTPILSGVVWRVFTAGSDPQLVTRSDESTPTFTLFPGDYIVHLAYGLAGTSKRISVNRANVVERLQIGAGGLVIRAAIGDQELPSNRMGVSLFIPSPGDSESKLVTSNLKTGELIRLPEGSYHVVTSYGDSNSIMRADIAVKAGKLTEATMLHKAAVVTLKLVSRPGAEALANTAWSVLTPGGDVIREAIGAFPNMTLAEGDYLAIARHEGKVYQGDFRVQSGLDHDVEIVAAAARKQ